MKNLVASLQDRLKNQGREQGIAYGSLLEQFALSRFLARLEASPYADRFILKGAQLFRFLSDGGHRPTRDADFLSFSEHDPDTLENIFTTICEIQPEEEDALIWENIRATAIRDDNRYGGVRLLMTAKLGTVRIPLQFDVGFGDVITPEVRYQKWTSPLGYADVSLGTYPLETVISEKLEAAVSLDLNNSRMKDFYDLHWLKSQLQFDGGILMEAVTQTFDRRDTPIPESRPFIFTEDFYSDAKKNHQWDSFVRKSKLDPVPFSHVINNISTFLLPVLEKKVSGQVWTPTKHWKPISSS